MVRQMAKGRHLHHRPEEVDYIPEQCLELVRACLLHALLNNRPARGCNWQNHREDLQRFAYSVLLELFCDADDMDLDSVRQAVLYRADQFRKGKLSTGHTHIKLV